MTLTPLIATEKHKLSDITFDEEAKLLTRALINRTLLDDDSVIYSLFNPSIADFVIANHMEDIVKLDLICTCLNTEEAIQNIINSQSITGNEKLAETYQQILKKQISTKLSNYQNEAPTKQLVMILLKLMDQPSIVNHKEIDKIRLFIGDVLQGVYTEVIDYQLIAFLDWLIETNEVITPNNQLDDLITTWLEQNDLDMIDYTNLSALLVKAKSSQTVIDIFKQDFLSYYQEGITEDVIDNLDVTGFDDETDETIYQHVVSQFEALNIEFDDSEMLHIAECCDIYDVQKSYMNACEGDHSDKDWRGIKTSSVSYENPVDDLFDRS